jgi:hypothetical protein
MITKEMERVFAIFMPIADIETTLALLIPIGLLVVVPIVAIMTAHHRRMAELGSGGKANFDRVRQLEDQVTALRHEVGELRGFITDNVLELDDKRLQARLGPPPVPPNY